MGIDGTLVSQASGKDLNTKLSSKSIDLVCEEENLVDLIWKDRPAIPCTPVLYLTKEDAGLDVTEKVTKVGHSTIFNPSHYRYRYRCRCRCRCRLAIDPGLLEGEGVQYNRSDKAGRCLLVVEHSR